MTEKIYKLMNDNPVARWSALILIALMMFFGYMFVDVMSPIQSLIESERGWTPGIFGTYAAAEYILNVCGFLILAGIILDKMGIRFTGTLSASLMVIGAVIKYIGISDGFQESAFADWLNTWWVAMPASAKMASLGFMLFGCGCEMAGITVSRSIAKWFDGKEMALAMGLEMAIARIGVFSIFSISPWIAEKFGSVVTPVAFCTLLLCIGLIFFLVFCVMDKKFDKQIVALKGEQTQEVSEEDQFKLSDIKKIFSSQIFWVVALLCVLYYSAIFPFQRYGANMLQCNLGISARIASNIFRWFPVGAAIVTPFLGSFLDKKGKGATMLIWGAVLLIACHLIFAFVLPATNSSVIAYATIVILGVSFALVPAALWPSVPKVMNPRYLGSAYSLIFWVQNIGLCFVPMLIGNVLSSSNENNPAAMASKQYIESYQTAIYAIDTDTITFEQAYSQAVDDYANAKQVFNTLSKQSVAVTATAQTIDEAQLALETCHTNIAKIAPDKNAVDKMRKSLKEKANAMFVPYHYTVPLIIFACFGIIAFFMALYLKLIDKKHNYGLEEPNIKK